MAEESLRQEPYATTFKHLVDMKAVVGTEIGLTDWFQIDQEKINTFATLTEDEQWIHVDPEKSKLHSPYKTTVAHGFMVLSLASKFVYETCTVNDIVMGVNYGLDKVRFPNATPCGAMLRGRVSLIDFEERPNAARYKVKIVFELQGQEKPACVAEFIAMAYTAE